MELLKILQIGKQTIEIEADELRRVGDNLSTSFAEAVQAINQSDGRLIVTGIGKSGNIAQKLVATFNSTGTPAIFMHAADALHGDLGILQKKDIVLCISNSGNSPEIKVLIPFIKGRGNQLIAIVGKQDSYLATSADFVIDSSIKKEACLNNLAPTSSTTAQMALGDALAVSLMNVTGFTAEDFAQSHPGGSLGKRLFLKVDEICENQAKPIVNLDTDLKVVINEITKNRLGAAVVVENNKVVGVITDGDIRRMLQKITNLTGIKAEDIMTKNPKRLPLGTLAVEGLKLMQTNNISQLVIVDNDDNLAGIIHIHDLIKEGLVD